ncbi:kinase-like domain-containing protein [Mycena floridula]|nr:kinase-like domain-containing protein [Mycena floridula]
MSHALLLRLFLSPSFFTVHVALQYLKLYGQNIGITYYITRRLRELPVEDLRDVWGFFCHLVITRPSKSRALESFVVEIAHRSTHIAMITLWFMQAALKDLASMNVRHDSHSFMLCQRLLHKCHEIIFRDLPPTNISTPYSSMSLNVPFHARFTRRKIKHHYEPVIVGIGMVLAGAPALPQLNQVMGEVAVEQGRVEEEGAEFRSVESSVDDLASPAMSSADLFHEEDTDDSEPETPAPDMTLPRSKITSTPIPPHKRTSLVIAAQTAPALPLHLRGIRRSRMSEDPLGQLDEPAQSPYQSSPSVSSYSRPAPPRSASVNLADVMLQNYDQPTQMHLLRSHYCRSEVQFILALESIANRLLVVPKPARVSALRAELTGLNHKLPAEVCMPMWCSSSDSSRTTHGVPQPHHRIVRVPPGESVVLNSAERAPYLLLIEILNQDLDFDPSQRSNKEILKKIVLNQNNGKGASKGLIPFESPSAHRFRLSHPANDRANTDPALEEPTTAFLPDIHLTTPTSSTLQEEQEIDLVEQLYGTDQSLLSRTIDLSESIVLPPAPKNRDLDRVAWASSAPSSPAVDNGAVRVRSSLSFTPETTSSTVVTPEAPVESSRNSISMDEYAERMRTAAIMLAQLNANLVRESLQSAQESGSKSWIPGSSWLMSSADPPQDTQPLPARLRLQLSEATAIRNRIMQEMLALEEERVERMRENKELENGNIQFGDFNSGRNTAEDEGIIRRELNKVDPSAIVFSESWAAKKSRIRHNSPYGHLANWDCVSVIVKTGGDLRQEQLAVQLIRQFQRIWEEEKCSCWLKPYHILITGGTSGLMETITDAVSIHSIKKSEYARRLAEGRLGHVTLLDHFKATYGDPSSAKFARAQRNFAKSLAGYSIVTYLLQIKDRHNGNILLDRDGHLIHIDFGFILSNTPGNIGFEAAPFKLPPEYVEVMGGVQGPTFLEFRRLFKEGFETARKHCDSIITLVELMQKDSTMPCFAAFGEQTANQLRDRFQPALTHSLVGDLVDRLIDSSLGSHWTRLYDSYQYYSQSIL